jgi:hypothetical protein
MWAAALAMAQASRPVKSHGCVPWPADHMVGICRSMCVAHNGVVLQSDASINHVMSSGPSCLLKSRHAPAAACAGVLRTQDACQYVSTCFCTLFQAARLPGMPQACNARSACTMMSWDPPRSWACSGHPVSPSTIGALGRPSTAMHTLRSLDSEQACANIEWTCCRAAAQYHHNRFVAQCRTSLP